MYICEKVLCTNLNFFISYYLSQRRILIFGIFEFIIVSHVHNEITRSHIHNQIPLNNTKFKILRLFCID